MDIYLVGGAVRDELLGRPPGERDWLVVGGTADELLSLGYRRVGKAFPVFLHPESNEEYALARTERKTAAGHRGFAVHAGAEVSLEEDLARRDLTVNAMAKDLRGRLIDPFGGRRDLSNRVLRHVGDAFREDPLRVFRLARFAAQLEDFSVHESTVALIAVMAPSLAELPAERVWAEFRKALAAPDPQRFIDVLKAGNCLGHWLPELEDARLDPRPDSARGRYGSLGWMLGEAEMQRLSKRLKVANDHAELALAVCRHGHVLAEWRTVEPERLYAAAKAVGAFRSVPLSRRVFELVGVLAHTPLDGLQNLLARVAADIHAGLYVGEGLSGPALGRRLERGRIERLATVRGGIPESLPMTSSGGGR